MVLNNKYELTDSIDFFGRVLYRIRSLRTFGNVRCGDLGGYVEGEHNLSHDGNCWIFDDGKVYDDARISDDATIHNFAQVCDNARVYNTASVTDFALVANGSSILNSSIIGGNAVICGDAVINLNSHVGQYAIVSNNSVVTGFSVVQGCAVLKDNAIVSFCRVGGLAVVTGSVTSTPTNILIANGGHLKKASDVSKMKNIKCMNEFCVMSVNDIKEYRNIFIDFDKLPTIN